MSSACHHHPLPSVVSLTRRLSLGIYHCPWKDVFLIIQICFSATDSSQTKAGGNERWASRSLDFSKNELKCISLWKRNLFLPVCRQSQCVSKATIWEVIVKQIIEVMAAKPPAVCSSCLCQWKCGSLGSGHSEPIDGKAALVGEGSVPIPAMFQWGPRLLQGMGVGF